MPVVISPAPSSLPPSGAASGDLTGTYPGPTIATTKVVKSIAKAGSTALKDAVTLTGGTNVTLTQAGQDISIAAAGGSLPNPFVVTGTDQAAITAKIVGADSQFASLLRVLAEAAGPVVLKVDDSGTLTVTVYDNALANIRSVSTFGQNAIDLEANDASGTTVAAFTIAADGVTTYDGSFNKITGTLSSGPVIAGTHAAPASGDIAAGECGFWFDQTDGVGNTKLMLKGKSADGTVKTATILLA